MEKSKSRLTPEKVVNTLKKHGTTISLEQAEKVLDFYKKFAKLWLNQVFKS